MEEQGWKSLIFLLSKKYFVEGGNDEIPRRNKASSTRRDMIDGVGIGSFWE